MDVETKSIIRSLVASNPLKSTIRSILKDYYDTVGAELPFKQLGFSNPELYLRSLPDVVQVVGSGPYAEVLQVRSQKLDHINELISKQKLPKCFQNRRRPVVRARVAGTSNASPHNATPPNINFIRRHLSLPVAPLSSNNYQRNVMNHPLFAQSSIQPYLNQQRYQNGNSYSNSPSEQKSPLPREEKLQPETEAPYRLSEPPRRRRSPDPPQKHRSPEPSDRQKSSEPPHRYRPPTFDRATTSTPFQEPKPSPTINTKYIENNLCAKEVESMFHDVLEDRVPEEVKDNLRNLIADYPEGIWCCDLPKLYVTRFKTELDYAAYKFRTLNEMCLYLSSIFHYIRPNKGDFKLYDKRVPIPEDLPVQQCLESEENKQSTATNFVDDSVILLEALSVTDEPANVVGYLEDIPRQWLLQDQTEGSLMDIWVAEVYDPSKFWFIINKQKLDDMMNEMQDFYAENKHIYEVPKHKLIEGLYCVAILFSEYHRALVVAKSEDPTEDKIKLLFIDYGTVATVPVSGICYLHRKYAVLPQQALRGRLAGIYPPYRQQQWSRKVSSRFFDLVAEKPLVARIEKINLQKQFVHLTLIETPPKGSTQPPIFIHEILLKESHAVASPEAQTINRSNKYAVPVIRHLHFYPTYEELEQGLMPSAPEMINLLNNGCALESIYPQYYTRTYYKHELERLRKIMFESKSASSDELAEAPNTCNSAATDEMKSSGTDEMINFTEDLIPDKGGTNSSNINTTREVSHQEKINLKLPSSDPAILKELQNHPPENIPEKVISFETQQSRQTGTMQEVVEESIPTEVTVRPPPGFERLQPGNVVQQNIMVPPQNYSYGTPFVQQNYFLSPYGGAYQLPYGYPSNYPLQMPYNYFPMYAFQQMVPSIPQQIPAQFEPIITEYLNSLRNDDPVIEAEKSDTSDSDLVACGSLANKDNDKKLKKSVKSKTEVVEIEDEAQRVKKNESEIKVSQQEEINQQTRSINESEENTKKKKPKQKKQKTSESEQKETVTKRKQEDEEAKTNPNKEDAIENKTKKQEAKSDVNKQHTSEKNDSPNTKVNKAKESVKTTKSKQRTPQKNENSNSKTERTKENTTENPGNKLTPTKSKVSQVETNGKTEKSKSISNKTNKRKENVDIYVNAEHKETKSAQNKYSSSTKTKGKTDNGKSKNDASKENVDIFDNKLIQSKTEVLQVVETNSKTEKTSSINNKNDKIVDISEISENTLEQKTKVSHPVEPVDNWEELIVEDVYLFDSNETELVEVLSYPVSRTDSEQQLDILEKFFVDSTTPLLPQKLTDCDAREECVEDIIEGTAQTEHQNYVEKKVIAGKTINVVTWEKKRYVACNEALKTYTGLELSVLSTKSRLSRRMIFMTDIDVNTVNTDMQDEFIRNNLVTASKFGKFVHLIQLEQLPSFVETFTPGVQLNIADIL